MERKKIYRINIGLLFISFIVFVSNPQGVSAEMSIESYCQFTVQKMQLQISNIQELIEITNQYSHDPDTLAQLRELKGEEFAQAEVELYTLFGTTLEGYITYMGKYGKEVNEYLSNNPEIKQQIDDLAIQVDTLMEQFESL